MSHWRFVVRPDGTFFRIGNADGSFDHDTNEELLRYDQRGKDSTPTREPRPCSRCGKHLLLNWHGPLWTGAWMELCADCDQGRPAADALTRWIRDAQRSPDALPQLFDDWETETMTALGWNRISED
ncbi:hypothetical protein GCM10023205_76790 [Yinghuangia aomiensis]|uniref:Uncharacterized protein n=1 Tax=Yinghuangia aomiensis TaxID=676205 RepID=A0ABP9IAQ6_9ACTN